MEKGCTAVPAREKCQAKDCGIALSRVTTLLLDIATSILHHKLSSGQACWYVYTANPVVRIVQRIAFIRLPYVRVHSTAKKPSCRRC